VRPLSPLRHSGVAVASLLAAACTTVEVEPRAEIQINLCSEPQAIIRALDLQPAGAAPREAWYFETSDLALFRRGAVLRLRFAERERELTLKAADQDCARVSPALLPRGEGKCEYDLHGADFKGAVSITRDLDERTVRELVDGRMPLAAALSEAQIRYLREGLSAWPLVPGVEPRGPVWIRAYRPKDRRFVVEMWQLPGGARHTEISQKADVAGALRYRSELEKSLAEAGVALCADQSSQAGDKLRALVR
jgi:hypothetical protein